MASNRTGIIDRIVTVALIFGIWKVLTFFFSPFVVPPIASVFKSIVEIFSSGELCRMILITILRLFIGLGMGVLLGLALGILMGRFKRFKSILLPIIGIMQTVPPVSWVVLALVWFGFNGRPAVFIIVTATLPIIAISVNEGIENIDSKLMQMADLYKFTAQKRFAHVIFPSIASYFKSSFRIALGNGWKIAVMGEVLTTNDGIGGMIKEARLNIEPEAIIAWSIVVVVLFYLSDFLISLITTEKKPC